MTEHGTLIPEAASWLVESLRATTFHPPGESATASTSTNTWEKIVGEQPEQILMRPREGVTQQSGNLLGKPLVLISRQDRVDWILQGVIGPPVEPLAGPPTLGPLPGALESFERVVEKWLSASPTTTRLAFGAALFIRVNDLGAAYRELSRFLPNVKLGDADSPDFLYQVNRPRTSKLPISIRINRLAKWSVMQGGTISIGIGTSGGPMSASASPELACRLELDINTAAESVGPISHQETRQLFDELVAFGKEIVENGDVP